MTIRCVLVAPPSDESQLITGSNDSIPGAADWVAGYLSRNKTDEDHSASKPLEALKLGIGFSSFAPPPRLIASRSTKERGKS